MPRPWVIAHRGASAAYPENTVEAFHGARAMGAEWVELDARRTVDGTVVVHHDAHLPDGRPIIQTPAADLPPAVPSLAEALDACLGMGVNIEIKNSPDDPDFDPEHRVAEQVVTLLIERDRRDEILISSFNLATIDRCRALEPTVATAWLVIDPPADAVEVVVAGGHDALHPYDWFVDVELVERSRAAGIRLNVWTVDDPDRLAELAALGVDGLCTNVPDVARTIVDALSGQ